MNKTSTCRGCGKTLNGDGSQCSSVSDPVTKESAKWNYYGCWVCSRQCDYNASLELEKSMPGHMGQKSLSIGSESYRTIVRNWPSA